MLFQVKNEKLRRCVEQNRRVVIIITDEFSSSDACLFCLQGRLKFLKIVLVMVENLNKSVETGERFNEINFKYLILTKKGYL